MVGCFDLLAGEAFVRAREWETEDLEIVYP